MTVIYRMKLKRGCASRPDVYWFYDEDREKVIAEMQKYNKVNGFSIKDKYGTFSISDIVLQETTGTGEIISETPYHKLFDVYGKRIKERARGHKMTERLRLYIAHWKRETDKKDMAGRWGFIRAKDKADAWRIMQENLQNGYEVTEITEAHEGMITPQAICVNFWNESQYTAFG